MAFVIFGGYMNYIVLDLEWNQSPSGKKNTVEDIPFEIIQMGAVKLDEKYNIIGEFNKNIRPKVYMQLHSKVEEVVGVTMEELLEDGEDFERVAADFLEWCGYDYIICTWGSMDLTELQRNMKHYGIDAGFPQPFLYYDLQKLFSICYSDGKTRITLEHAIDQLGIKAGEEYHRAVNDARYTAKIIKYLDMDRAGKYYSVDTFKIPANRKEEIHLDFGDYGKFISKGFETREQAVVDREVRSCKCFKCKKSMKKHIKWFATNGKSYYGLFECEKHGLIKGRFKSKQADNGLYYIVKILKCTDQYGAEKIKKKQEKERLHRRMKAKAEKEAKKNAGVNNKVSYSE